MLLEVADPAVTPAIHLIQLQVPDGLQLAGKAFDVQVFLERKRMRVNLHA